MSRRNKVQFELSNVQGINLDEKEINAILRAADEIIFQSGRTMLAKVLKGSKEKRLMELGLNVCPTYGYFNDKTINQITVYIDWMIINDYLDISYKGQLPMIVFSEKGWELYKPIYAFELYNLIFNISQAHKDDVFQTLENANREVIIMLLYMIGESKNIGFIRFLQEWELIAVKKVKAKIRGAINKLKSL